MDYRFVMSLVDRLSGPLARISQQYTAHVGRWEGLTRRFQSGFTKAAQTVEQLKRKLGFGREMQNLEGLNKKLDALTKKRDVAVGTSAIRSANREIEALEKRIHKMQNMGRSGGTSGGGGSGGLMTMAGRAALPYLGVAAIGAGAVSGFSEYAQIDALKRGLVNIEGSQAGADRRFGELRKAAAAPGLGIEEAVQSDLRLRSLGFGANNSMAAITQTGNALALTGGGKFDLNNVLTQFTQMASKPGVLSEDLKPILNSGPAIAKAVKDLYGSVNADSISDILEKQGKGPMEFINQLVAKLATLPRAADGPKNALENLGDSFKIASYNAGSTADKYFHFTQILNAVGGFIVELSDKIEPLIRASAGLFTALAPLRDLLYGIGLSLRLVGDQGSGVSTIINTLAGIIDVFSTAIGLALSPVGQLILFAAGLMKGLIMLTTFGVGGLITGLQTLWVTMLANPFTAVLIGILAIGTAIAYAWEHFDGFREMIIRTWAIIKNIFGSMGKVLLAIVYPSPENVKAGMQAVMGGLGSSVAAGDAAVKADRASRQAVKAEKIAKAAGAPKPGVPKPTSTGGTSEIGKAGGVKSGVEGAKSTNITINLKSLVEGGIHISAATVEQGLDGMEDKVSDALLRILNSANAMTT